MHRIKRIGIRDERHPMPNLLVVQVESFREFTQEDILPEKRKDEGLQGVFKENFPIEDIHGKYILEFIEYRISPPKYTPEECKKKKLTYSAPVWARLRLVRKDPSTDKFEDAIDQEVYLCEMPYMTNKGTFVINGVERVIVNQLHRSPGIYFEGEEKGTASSTALLVPYRGPWIEFTIDNSKVLGMTVSKRRRIPITRFLRAIGFNTSEEIINAVLDPQSIPITQLTGDGRYALAEDLLNPKSGEVMYEVTTRIDEDMLETLKHYKIKKLRVVDTTDPRVDVVLTTLRQDRIKDTSGALGNIYRTLRYTPPKDEDEAEQYIKSFFFSPMKFYLGQVGRYKLNFRLGLSEKKKEPSLTSEDLLYIVKRLLNLYIGEEKEDDVDDLSNRRVKRVGELLYEQFRIALIRLSRVIRERMLLLEKDASVTPKKLVNPRLITSSILSFFTGDRLSQFLDQSNPLAELTHKRRLSALGRGGLTRETAGFEVRDVHPSNYGRLCPIETPEGQNIGLITSLTTYAKIDPLGFITTPLIKIKNGRITNEVAEITSNKERELNIAPADTPVDRKTGSIIPQEVWVRSAGGYPIIPKEEVDYIDVSPRQLVSPSASLIPFLEHDDANRALMGCNMQRQGVPILMPEPPIVGTGMEAKIARDSGTLVLAKRAGTVIEVDATRIVVKPSTLRRKELKEESLDVYELTKFQRSNQNTIVNQRPVVQVGDTVEEGDLLADASATSQGELALGRNLLVAFIPWFGYNFEDAIVVSERISREDIFTSIHILEFEVEVRETKIGPEEVTRDLPNVSEEAVRNLDEYGIVRIGAEVKPDDILVGKVSPKGERELSPEERLIYAIFAEKAKDVRDTSKRVPPGVQGVVLDVVVLSKRRSDPLSKKILRNRRKEIELKAKTVINSIEKRLKEMLIKELKGKELKKGVKNQEGRIIWKKGTNVSNESFGDIDPLGLVFPSKFVEDEKLEAKIKKIMEDARRRVEEVKTISAKELSILERGDELPPGVLQLIKVYVAEKRKLEVGDKLAGRHGNKGVVAAIAPMEDMPFLEDGTPVDIVLNPLGVPSRMNIGQILETVLGWAGKEKGVYYASPVFEGMDIEDIQKELASVNLPVTGKAKLRDGLSGEFLDYEVTVGYIYMFKLIHMVEDKVHARATGPYSLITQQPVGGKSHFGGQRLGEMEVWALEAYGAAYTLQEMLTVKSDDIKGRNQLYQAIIKGEEPPEPGLPASFDVLLKELRGLALDVEIETK